MAYTRPDGIPLDIPAQDPTYEHRTAAVSCRYLLPHLARDARVLDVGCGPGGITRGLAARAREGEVVAVDAAPAVLAVARAVCAGLPNVSFAVADAEDLRQFPDQSFDVVHAHQVLRHLNHPERAMREFYRLLRPGGVAATSDNHDPECTFITQLPELPEIRILWDALTRWASSLGGSSDVSRRKRALAVEAGFHDEDIVVTQSGLNIASAITGIMTMPQDHAVIKTSGLTAEQMQKARDKWYAWKKEGNAFLMKCDDVLCFKR